MTDLNTPAPRKHNKAALKDILGVARKAPRIEAKWRGHYDRLIELRDRFTDQRGNLVKDASEETPSSGEHMADAGTDSYDRDFTLSLLSSEQNALYEIEQALKRIETGTFGRCEESGEPIELERLDAIPWARFSAKAEMELEQRGGGGRAKLGALGSIVTAESSSEDADSDEE